MSTVTQAADATRVLTFDVDGTQYCTEADRVMAVLGVDGGGGRVVDDDSDPWYAGQISLEDERIRVLDLARVFGSPTASPERSAEPQVVVFDAADDEGALFGWLVERVDTKTVRSNALDRARTSARFVDGRLDHDGEEFVWLDERAINS